MQNSVERDFKGIWIPKETWLEKELSIMEKVFLAEIDSLDTGKGCYASNKYFAEFFGISPKRASAIISDLVKKDYLVSWYSYKGETKEIDKRFLKLSSKFQGQNEAMGGGIPKNEDTPPDFQGYPLPKNREDITKRYNKVYINQSKDIDADINEKGTTTTDLIDDDLEFLFSEITKHKVFYKASSDILKQAQKFFKDESASEIAQHLRHYWEKKYKLSTGWNSGAWFVSDFLPKAHETWAKQKEEEEEKTARIKELYSRYKSGKHDFAEEYSRFSDRAGDPNDRRVLQNKNYKSIDEIDHPTIKTDFLQWVLA